ncbi:MAG: hypothetical protein DI603_02545 [Roseateles depolymerans]|uniref:Uncharacterized protein n=1 Tax=Roseateles depolymerans TaxID=76731 RepID=A0A2W5DUS8_9BURK|nr:MAG: hypothetical protein DI603_02545 [Roseateles depolymerans]
MTTSIPALTALRPIDAQTVLPGGREFQLGELLKLRVVQGADGGLLGSDGLGLLVPLPAGAGQAQPGDTLLLRVLSLRPRMELQFVERQAQSGSTVPAAQDWADDSPALRTDQAWLASQRFARAAPAPLAEPGMIAIQWRAQAFAELQRAARVDEAGWPVAAALPDEGLLPQTVFQLGGWQNQAVLLRLLLPLPGQLPWLPVERDGRHEPGGEASADDGSSLLLCITLEFRGDRVQVLLMWDHGLLLHFAADQASTLEHVRALLPGIASALAAVPLRLRSCLLSVRSPSLKPPSPERIAAGLAETSCGALFRAAAEIAKLLQLAQPRDPITAISR